MSQKICPICESTMKMIWKCECCGLEGDAEEDDEFSTLKKLAGFDSIRR